MSENTTPEKTADGGLSSTALLSLAGIHHQRLKENNPREAAMSEQWEKEHKRDDLLRLLLRVRCEPSDEGAWRQAGTLDWYRMPVGEPTERDRIIVSTVIQWLGSNVGLGFLQDAFERCGYRIQYPDNANGHTPAE